MRENCLIDSLCKYVGQTVTIFTTSGGQGGSGFTGVLASVNENCIKLITDIGAAPTCPLGNSCGSRCGNNWGYNRNNNCNWNNCNNCNNGNWGGCCGSGNRWVGSVTEIPICKIASFTHNAI